MNRSDFMEAARFLGGQVFVPIESRRHARNFAKFSRVGVEFPLPGIPIREIFAKLRCVFPGRGRIVRVKTSPEDTREKTT